MDLLTSKEFIELLSSNFIKQEKAIEWINELSFEPLFIAYPFNFEYINSDLILIHDWCTKNLNNNYEFRFKCFAFETTEDAMAFKIRWL